MSIKSDGSTASYYELPEGCTELQDLISHRNMNAQDGEIFRAIYRKGMASHSDALRDARKVLFYAEAEVKRLMAVDARRHPMTPNVIEPAFAGGCLVCGKHDGHSGLPCPKISSVSASASCEPASQMQDDSPRMAAIGQNGNSAEHYSEIDRLRAAADFNDDLPV